MKVIELKNAIFMKTDKDLLKYINKEFCSIDSTTHKIKNKMETIKRLDDKTIQYGIARMNKLEWKNDVIKTAAPSLMVLLAFITSYTFFYKNISNEVISSAIGVIIGLVVLISSVISLTIAREKISKIVFFRSLLEQCRSDNK